MFCNNKYKQIGGVKTLFDRNDTEIIRGVSMLMIIIYHTANYLYYQHPDEATCMLPIYFTQQLGYLGTGLFFFLSGYGMICSLRHNRVDRSYIKKKCNSIFLPFVLSWIVFLTFLFVFDRNLLQADLWLKFISLSTPNGILWFYNVIVALYIIVLLLFRFSKNEKLNIAIVFSLTLAYIPIANCAGLSSWWYNSILCFPIGMVCAVYKFIIEKYAFRIVIVSTAGFVVLYMFIECLRYPVLFQIVLAPLLAIAVSTIVKYLPPLKNRFISFVGNKSLYFYLLHSWVYTYITFTYNFILLSVETIVITSFIVLMLIRLKTLCRKYL